MNRIDKAITLFGRMRGYRATIRASRPGEGPNGGEIIRYAWQRPGRIRMEFERPHKGARLVYDPAEERVYLWPFGGFLPPMKLSPDNLLIQSPSGQRVDRSDIGSLLDNVRALEEHGRAETLDAKTTSGRSLHHVTVVGAADATVGNVHRYELWFDDETGFPVKVTSFDKTDREIETVQIDDVVIDPDFPSDFFSH